MAATKLDKILKKLPQVWIEEADTMSESELRDTIVQSERNIQISKEEMEANEGYQEAKASFDEVRAPMRDAVKFQKAKIEYAIHLLQAKGKLE